jgi:hypothetical protein
MTSFTRMHWTGVEPFSTPSPAMAAQALLDSVGLDHEALRRERLQARRLSNLKWMCVGGGVAWVGFVLLSL